MYFLRSSYVIFVRHHLWLVRTVISQYEIYYVAPKYLYKIQHNPIRHIGTAEIQLPQVIHGDETTKRPLLIHVHIYKKLCHNSVIVMKTVHELKFVCILLEVLKYSYEVPMYFCRSSYVICMCHHLRLVHTVISQYEIYYVAPYHWHEMQHNSILQSNFYKWFMEMKRLNVLC